MKEGDSPRVDRPSKLNRCQSTHYSVLTGKSRNALTRCVLPGTFSFALGGGEVVILTTLIPVRFNCSFLFSTGSVSGVLAGKGHSDLIQQRLDKSSCNKIRWLSAFWLLNGVLVKL